MVFSDLRDEAEAKTGGYCRRVSALHVFDMALERVATVAYRGDSLVDAHALGRRLLDRRQ